MSKRKTYERERRGTYENTNYDNFRNIIIYTIHKKKTAPRDLTHGAGSFGNFIVVSQPLHLEGYSTDSDMVRLEITDIFTT